MEIDDSSQSQKDRKLLSKELIKNTNETMVNK